MKYNHNSLSETMVDTLLREIAARAESIPERVVRDRHHEGDPDKVVEWANKYDETLFDSRLEWFDLDKKRAVSLFGEVNTDGVTIPGWTKRLRTIFAAFMNVSPAEFPDTPYPFGDLLTPIVEYAVDDVQTQISGNAWLGEEPLVGFRQLLLQRLSTAAAQPLHVEYRLYCHEQVGTSDPADVASQYGDGSQVYDAFVDWFYVTGHRKFFRTYAVLARQVVTIVDDWCAMVAEFCRRFEQDRATVISVFCDTEEISLDSVEPGLGDPHEAGRTVIRCLFSDGSTCYYKPRSVAPEQAVTNLLTWMAENGELSYRFTSVELLKRDEYGWMEHVPDEEMVPGEETDYYRRIGGLAILLYALNGGDIHYENLIASGDQPVVIDWEIVASSSVFHQFLPSAEADMRLSIAERTNSVLASLLLPHNSVENDRLEQDLSAVGRLESTTLDHTVPRWELINSNGMSLREAKAVVSPQENVPTVAGVPVRPEEYVDEILEGAEEMYRVLQARSADIIEHLEQQAFDEIETRYLIRPTAKYQTVRNMLSSPGALRDGASAWLAIEELFSSHDVVTEEAYDQLWHIADAESAALRRRDVPRFIVDSKHLRNRDARVVEEFFDRSKTEIIRDRLNSFSAADRRRQLAYIKAVLRRRGLTNKTDQQLTMLDGQ